MKHLPDQVAESLGTSKPWWLSKTIISGLAGLVTAFVGLAGVTLDLEMVNEIVTLVLVIAFLIGVILGRFDAKQPVSLRRHAKMPPGTDSGDRAKSEPFTHGFGGDY